MDGCWTKKKEKEEEEAIPQFQMVKKKRRRNRSPGEPRFDLEATSIIKHPERALNQESKEKNKTASP